MPTNLTDYNIDDTYGGIIHASGTALPIVDKVDLYDGTGNKTSLKLGRSGYGATIDGRSTINGFTVIGDISASGRTTVGHIDALSGSTAPNIPKAYVCFNPPDQVIYTKYGIESVSRTAEGRYRILINSETTAILNSMSDTKYAIFVNASINEADQDKLWLYSNVASDSSDNNGINIRCTKHDGTSISFYDPSEISVSIFKTK